MKAVGEGNDLRAKVVVGLWKNIEDRKQVNDGREKVTNGEEEGEVCSKYAKGKTFSIKANMTCNVHSLGRQIKTSITKRYYLSLIHI